MNAAELLRAVIFVLKSRSGRDSVDKNGAADRRERERGKLLFPSG